MQQHVEIERGIEQEIEQEIHLAAATAACQNRVWNRARTSKYEKSKQINKYSLSKQFELDY